MKTDRQPVGIGRPIPYIPKTIPHGNITYTHRAFFIKKDGFETRPYIPKTIPHGNITYTHRAFSAYGY